MAKYNVSVDVGGTFTDCVVMDEKGHTSIAKSLTTPIDPIKGVLDATLIAAEQRSISLDDLLKDTVRFIHGTTVGTNALTERKFAKVGLITTKGFRDTIHIGRMSSRFIGKTVRERLDWAPLVNPPHIISLDYVVEVSERVDMAGNIVVELNVEEAEQAIETLARKKIEGIAICFLWSFLNPTHEQKVKQMVFSKYPHIFCSISSEIAPVIGEYERMITCLLNCFVGPLLATYCANLERALREKGYRYPLMLMKADGGITTVEEVKAIPIVTLDSGPAGGTIGGRRLSRLYNRPNIICTDVGGTTFDVSLVAGSELEYDPEPNINQYSYTLPKVLIDSVGAGGSSIAWSDRGVLRVGPTSAGSNPGPACYDRGGEQPTVTDADLVLGYLNPDYFWGGRMKLKKEKAEGAIKRIADELNMSLIDTALGIRKVVDAEMADLTRRCTMERGYDPREFTLLVYGGSGPVHAWRYTEEAGVKEVIVLSNSSVFSAYGMQRAPEIYIANKSRPLIPPFTAATFNVINTTCAEVRDRIYSLFEARGIPKEEIRLRVFLFARYLLQSHEVMMEIPEVLERPLTEADIGMLQERFHATYEGIYGKDTALVGGGIEFMTFRAEGTREISLPPEPKATEGPQDASRALKSQRKAYFEEYGGFVPCNVYDGDKLENGMVLEGPSIVERMGDSVVIPPHVRGEVDQYLNIFLTRKEGS